MRRTMLNTPLLTPSLRPLAKLILRILGWKVVGDAPAAPRYVMIAAPHTSNWDGVLLVLMAFVLRIPLYWLGKHTLFRFPFGLFMGFAGGIPVDRRRKGDLVARMAKVFHSQDEMVLVVPPEATRSRAERWKTGFYRIAEASGVPIGLGYLDWSTRTGGVGPLFEPTGALEEDIERIRAFYSDFTGRFKEGFGKIEV